MRASIVGLPATEALKSIWLSIGVFQRSRANFWLILATQQDPEPSSKKRGWETYKRSVISGQFGAAALAFALLFVPTQHANAGVASFLVQFFEAQVYAGEEMKISLYNIQNVPILRPALNVDPNPSKGGGDITVVDNSALLAVVGPSGTLADIENRPPQSDQISIYVVREGDSISQIADMFGVSVNTIVWANDLKRGTLITPGQTLVILPITGVQHSVKSG
ncbi:MAG: LysM domain-containing protein, partial [Candidatus Paceibacterota bacterium]